MPDMSWAALFFSREGRIGRQAWWGGMIVLFVINVVSIFVAAALFEYALAFGVAVLVLQLLYLYPAVCVSAKRFQDRDRPGALAWIPPLLAVLLSVFDLIDLGEGSTLFVLLNLLLMAASIWLLIELGFLRGSVGANQYGSDPLASAGAMH